MPLNVNERWNALAAMADPFSGRCFEEPVRQQQLNPKVSSDTGSNLNEPSTRDLASMSSSTSSRRLDGTLSDKSYYDVKGSVSSKKNATKFDFKNLQEQATKGSWRALLETVKEVRRISAVYTPDERIAYSTYHILALVKLGSYAAAAEELASIGDLDSRLFCYDEHPDLYPGMSGSMVPFSLRWLHAVLPHRLGQTATSIQRMYLLLDHCDQRLKMIAEAGKPGISETSSDHDMGPLTSSLGSLDLDSTLANEEEQRSILADRWRRRRDIVVYSILNLHLGQKDYLVALRFLDQMLARNLQNPVLWSRFGYVQLQLGDLEGAKLTFAKVEGLVKEKEEAGQADTSLTCLVGRNKGLESFVDKQYAAAVKAFNTVLEMNPGDGVAANNKALSLMYSRDLIRAAQVLEDMLQKHTVSSLNETLVLNLCSMYELAAVNSNESKRTLSTWILQVAPDDFDLTCTRL